MNIARLHLVMRREFTKLLAKYDYKPEIIQIDGKDVVNLSEGLIDAIRIDVDNFLERYYQQQLISDVDWLLSWENEDFKHMSLEVSFYPDGETDKMTIKGTIAIKQKPKDSYKDAWDRSMRGI